MLQTFRNFFQSKVGIFATLGLVALIALAFAGADISGSKSFGGVAGGDRVANVGNAKISASEFSSSMMRGLEAAKKQSPLVTMKAFIAGGGMDQVLNELVDSKAVAEFGQKYGIVAGKRLVDSELAKAPGLQGLDGKFSQATYQQLLAQKNLTDAEVHEQLAGGMIEKQILIPVATGGFVPLGLSQHYAAMIGEHRNGLIAVLPASKFAPKTPPSADELSAYYAKNRANYTRPERRTIRYASFTDTALKQVAAPSDAEISAKYTADKDKYAASENRKITQLIAPTEAAAKAILAEVSSGKSLESAAGAKGLAAASLGSISKEALQNQSSVAVADAAFAGAKGKVIGPVKSVLGWHLLRIDALDSHAARSLDQMRGDITKELVLVKRRAALADMTAAIEDAFDKGDSLSDRAKDLGITIQQTKPLIADGHIYGTVEVAPAELNKILKTAFTMEQENQPQLAEIEAGKSYIIFDVGQISASAPAPMTEITNDLKNGYMLEKGEIAAKAAAIKMMQEVRKGKDLNAAIAGLGMGLSPANPVAMSREQLRTLADKAPPPIQLMFRMAKGTVKLQPAPKNAGWFVVQLSDVQAQPVQAGDPLLGEIGRELGKLTGNEYAQQMRTAIRKDVGVKRNEVAIKAVATQVSGGN
ncbi:MAG: hypothetical protein RLY97_1507 [Pseudomonadota bacterium]